MVKRFFIFSFVVLLASCAVGDVKNGNSQFHPPQTEAEKALDKIFKLYDNDDSLDGFIFNHSWYRHAKDKEFLSLFSQDFLDRAAREEKNLIKESCGGIYPADGLPCDMIRDVNPVYCAQDTSDTLVYSTVKLTKDRTIIAYTGLEYAEDIHGRITGATYRMVKDNSGSWRLDAIDCEGTFNVP